MAHNSLKTVTIATLLFSLSGALAKGDESPPAEMVYCSYVQAFAAADLQKMSTYYAPTVTVLRGSTLLDQEYGGLGGEDGREKDKTVTRKQLLAAYDRAFQVFQGRDTREDWAKSRSWIAKVEVLYLTKDSPNGEKMLQAIGANNEDIIAIAAPKEDAQLYVIRKIKGHWQIIIEFWD